MLLEDTFRASVPVKVVANQACRLSCSFVLESVDSMVGIVRMRNIIMLIQNLKDK